MKVRDSGMPDETLWEQFFDVELIMDRLGIGDGLGDVAELGCGYGTFTIAAARRVSGTVYAYDIDEAMASRTRRRAAEAGTRNVVVERRDVLSEGFGSASGSLDGCLLFNILHNEHPVAMLTAAASVVRRGGRVFVIHWRHDQSTPRGPDLAIRPRPADIVRWAARTGRLEADGPGVDLPPWHFGLALTVSR
jgi:SAM-dependent methyltransferase